MSSLAKQTLPNRQSVEEATSLPENLTEKSLVNFNEQVDEALHAAGQDASLEFRQRSPPPQYPASEASSSSGPAGRPPAFSSLFASLDAPAASSSSIFEPVEPYRSTVPDTLDESPSSVTATAAAAPAYAPPDPTGPGSSDAATAQFQDETKRALPRDTKGGSSRSKEEEAEPPPAYSEGSSPLKSFTYLMAAAGGASSIITQVQQGGPPINPIGGELQMG